MDNLMILNNKNKGISYAELNNDELYLCSCDSKYSFKVYLSSNGTLEVIKNLKRGEKKQIEFSEYVLTEGNISALINPDVSYVQKLNEDELLFYFKFTNFKDIVYMSLKEYFDTELKSFEGQINFNLNDFHNGKIIYKYLVN